MSKDIILQVADTRFAVRCGHHAFNQWLVETCRGFISQDVPPLCLSLSLGGLPPAEGIDGADNRPSYSLSIGAIEGDHERIVLKIRVVCSNPADLFRLTLQLCLRAAVALKSPPDLLLHAAGIIWEDWAYLFVGPSGAGKSTVCKLAAGDSDFTVLHDDVIALTRAEEGFRAWSTPLKGEALAKSSIGAPLRAIFFLKQDQDNYVTRLSGWQIASFLASQTVMPLGLQDDRLTVKPAESLKLVLVLAESVPCYELHFKPDNGFWQYIRQLPYGEPAALASRGER